MKREGWGGLYVACLLLAGCATDGTKVEPTIVVKEVKVPVNVPCPKDPISKPVVPDSREALLAAPDAAARALLLAAGREVRDAFIDKTVSADQACRKTN